MNTSERLSNPRADQLSSELSTGAGTTVSKAAAQIIHGISELQALPEVALRVRNCAADPQAKASDLARIITSEPALASKLLKLANSAFYGLPSQVGSIHRAIIVLGFKTVQNLALAGSLCGLFRGTSISRSFSGQDLWKHCLAVAVAAGNLAKRVPGLKPDEAFMSGITHDAGILATRDARPGELEAAITAAEAGLPFLQAEQSQLGTDHTEVGLALTSMWRFPDHFRFVCRHHHAPAVAPEPCKPLVHAVHLADWLCAQHRIGFYLTAPKGPAPSDSLHALGLTDADLSQVAQSLADDIREAEGIFGQVGAAA